ncbi:hypothetical protein [Kitasatospora phosalacinea]|uniref:Uncharacterized protein n=1 Tax=Kitasatospora phosalacinea TaxID=2065 RepID=A0A9W6UT38_9ACTN|nr:hypothetical protein [Kitasatospora phosalacinea]GLW58200.1 hypothetical protein Kpho01_62110 [Kitasatospora phosalacinea]
MVLQILDVPDLQAIPGSREDEDTPLGRSAADVAHLARRLDIVQYTLVTVATSIRRDMLRVIDGDDADLPQSHGVLGSSAQSLDFLVVRRTELFQALERATGLHQVLAAAQPQAEQRPAAPAQEEKLTAPQREALEAVATGQVAMSDSGTQRPMRVMAAGLTVDRKALDALFRRKLVERDTSTSLFVGQTVRPTAADRRILAAATAAAAVAGLRSTAPATSATRRTR